MKHKYIPKTLSKKDLQIQKRGIMKSRKLYKQGIYYPRPHVNFTSKTSNHISKARKLYDMNKIVPSNELAKKTKCSKSALNQIVHKGRGAYYSSGSRPNQTAESWGLARLASTITGGPASKIDYSILESGCKKTSKALNMAIKPV